jgi:putative inorganic carbon (hco3(-)) transporter
MTLLSPSPFNRTAEPIPGDDASADRDRKGRFAFLAFLLLNAALFLRPAEIFPELQSDPGPYELLIYVCLAVSLPRVLGQLSLQSLLSRPITLCVVGLQALVLISGILNSGPGEMIRSGRDFSKLVIYYLLLVGVVDTPRKLRGFVYCLGGFILVLTLLALLQYHGFINIAALASYAEKQWEDFDAGSGQDVAVLLRLCAAGIYSNPNDLSRILVIGIMIALYGLSDRRFMPIRLLWLVLLAVFGYALTLTYSRGGFLCLLTSLTACLVARFGGKKSFGLALVLSLGLFAVFGGRQTNITTSAGTGRTRIEVWRDGFQLWRTSPLFGIGMENFAEELRIAAHNSFVHAYTELGLVGGTMYLGAFYLGVTLPYRATRGWPGLPDGELRRFGPYLIGIVAGYVMGMTSSSRNYVAPTYMIAGLAAVFMRLAEAYVPHSVTSLTGRLVREICLVSALTVAAHYVLIRVALAGG